MTNRLFFYTANYQAFNFRFFGKCTGKPGGLSRIFDVGRNACLGLLPAPCGKHYLQNIKRVTQGADFRPAIIIDDVKDLTIEKLSIPRSELPVIIYHNTQNIQAKNIVIPTGENAVIKR